MTGRILSGEQARAAGLVTHVSADPLAHAKELARELETRSPDAVAAAKFLLQSAWHAREGSALGYERRYQRRVIGRKNQRLALAQSRKSAASEPAAPYVPRRVES